MSMRALVVIAVLAVAVLGYVAWNQNAAHNNPQPGAPAGEQPSAPEASMPPGMPGGSAPPGMPGGAPGMVADTPSDPGIAWKVPAKWLTQITSGMRVATYIVPGAAKDKDAECAVYYFGAGKGGGVDANVQRWVAEFEKLDRHDLSRRDAGGYKVSIVDVRGTYAGHGMQQGESVQHDSWGLTGAIVEGPQGDVFFKLTGPRATVDAASTDFNKMLSSIQKK
jgi:hypothetical protein